MRARLIARTQISVPWPQSACVWPVDQKPPPGWEEVEVVSPLERSSSKILEKTGELHDLCQCDHERRHHTFHRGICLMKDCGCLRFREKR